MRKQTVESMRVAAMTSRIWRPTVSPKMGTVLSRTELGY
jgi:hypothetical protein